MNIFEFMDKHIAFSFFMLPIALLFIYGLVGGAISGIFGVLSLILKRIEASGQDLENE